MFTPPADKPQSEAPQKKVAFVLAGGGSRGAVQVGMVRCLQEQGVKPDIVTGVSIGALNGFYVAQNKLGALERHWRSIKTNDDVYRSRWLAAVMMYLGWQWGYPSLYKPGPIAKKLAKAIRSRKPSDFTAELRVGAVDLVTGNYVSVNQNHPLLHRFLTGCTAVPMVFPPVRIRKREDPVLAGIYVDGCVRNITPIGEAVRLGATEVHVLLTTSATIPPSAESHNRWLNLVQRSVDINMHQMFVSDIGQILLFNRLAELAREKARGEWRGPDFAGAGSPVSSDTAMIANRHIDLHVYHTQDAQLQGVLDFDPAAISDCIDLGYRLAQAPLRNAQLTKSLCVDITTTPHGHYYCDWERTKGTYHLT
jgi:NTE family protein